MSETGRPTDYTNDMLKRARGYLTAYQDMGDPIPTVAGLACVLGLTRGTLYRWAKEPDKAAFNDILEQLGQRQERALIKGGLLGEYNAPITKMMLTKHGYSDKVENDHTSSDGTMTPKGLDLSKLSNDALAELVAARDAASKD